MRHSNVPLPLLIAAVLMTGGTTVFSAAGYAADEAAFTVPKLSAYAGKSWGGLTLGETTQEGIKQQFRDGRGDYSTSVEVKTEQDQPFKISALFPGKDKGARLQGIVVRYRGEFDGLPLEKVTEQLGGPGTTYYPADDRYENWSVIAYPERGILLFAIDGKVNIILLGAPERLPQTVTALSGTMAPVQPLEKRYAGRVPELLFGTTEVSFSLGKNVSLRDKDEERRRIADDMRYRSLDGLHYQSGATGKFTITVSAQYSKDKGGTGTISAAISGDGKYGPLQTSLSRSFKIDSGPDQVRLEDTKYYRTLREALRDVEDDAARDARTQGPPPVTTFRRAAWDKLVDTYRFHSDPVTKPAPANNSGGLLD